MKKIQFSITDDQHKEIKEIAEAEGLTPFIVTRGNNFYSFKEHGDI